jgi:hypothetical protein
MGRSETCLDNGQGASSEEVEGYGLVSILLDPNQKRQADRLAFLFFYLFFSRIQFVSRSRNDFAFVSIAMGSPIP